MSEKRLDADAAPQGNGAAQDADWWRPLRDELPVVARVSYLNTGTAGPTPRAVSAAMVAEQQHELEHGRGSLDVLDGLLGARDEARQLAARLLGATPPEIALTHSSSDAINTVLGGIDFAAGDSVITTSLEHDALMVPLGVLAQRHGVAVHVADIGLGAPDQTLDALAAALEAAERPRLLGVSHLSYSSGALLPLREIGALCREHGVPMLVDGAQSCGALPVDVRDIGADYYTLSGQKWLLGPEGFGALYVAAERVGPLWPAVTGYFSAASHDFHGDVTLHDDARRFEVGIINRPTVRAACAALRWSLEAVQPARAAARSRELAGRAREALAALDGVTLVTPKAAQAGLFCFDLPKLGPRALAAGSLMLAREHDVVVRSIDHAPRGLRASLAWFNEESDIDRLVAGVSDLLGRDPQTLPADAQWLQALPEQR